MVAKRFWMIAFSSTLALGLGADPCPEGQGKTYPRTAEGAAAFLADAEAELLALTLEAETAAWVQSNFITYDTQLLAAKAEERQILATVDWAGRAKDFDGLSLPADTERKLKLLKMSLPMVAPPDPAKAGELTKISSSLEAAFSTGKVCTAGGECLDLTAIGRILETSRDPDQMLELWAGWHQVGPPMKAEYARFVELSNEGARGLGFADTGAMWRSMYDMSPEAFAAKLDRLWSQVRPLYEALHCHVRARLGEAYGTDRVPPGKPIPAHLLGNMWAQSWGNVYDLVAPAAQDTGFDLTERLVSKGVDELGMVKYGEGFFSSLGIDPLPATFWERSLFKQPRDREVVCHASAWDLDWKDDIRIKMCIQINAEDFGVVHHELGHNYYQRAYKDQSYLYCNSANDGFHEALGDTVALSVTPSYLKQVGLIDEEPPASADLGLLLRQALDKVAFLPFGLLIDQWRWKVFSGEVSPAQYNQAWWDLRAKYQGLAPPLPRAATDFDPGAKYHVPANTPYSRYFLSHILQFQFHRGLCRIAGIEGPLHRCSIYGNEKAGERLEAMMAMGLSRPWPEALEALTGERDMDASAILDYFAPLKVWLDEQNQGRTCGW